MQIWPVWKGVSKSGIYDRARVYAVYGNLMRVIDYGFFMGLYLVHFCIMASDKMTMQQRKDYAFILYTQQHLEQNIIAQRVGVRPNTVSKWVNENDGHWKNMRSRMMVTREQQINTLYEQLENLNKAIKDNKDKHPDTKQADIMIKLTAAIRNMEVELNIGDLVQAGVKFIRYAQKVGSVDQVMEISELWNSFIQSNLK